MGSNMPMVRIERGCHWSGEAYILRDVPYKGI